MAVSFQVIKKWMLVIFLVSIVITIITFVICFYFGQRFGGDNDFERTLGLYGTCTGTVPSGIALVRIVDPDFQTQTSIELGACNLVMLASTPVYIIILALAAGSVDITFAIIGLAGCVIAYLIILKVTKLWEIKHLAGKITRRWSEGFKMERIYYNGSIITMERSNAQEEIEKAPEAVWVKDGLIAGIGRRDDLINMADRNVCMVNLEGHCLMPSFVGTELC